MQVMEGNITTPRTARYTMAGADITSARHIWFACHGYGMLARYFIRKFEPLLSGQHCIIAPEGLNRAYLDGFSGKVGANWMTKEARLDDIADYITYLDLLHEHLGLNTLSPDQELIHFGFSQGVATIARYIAHGKYKPHKAVFWAGSFPPDLEPVEAVSAFAKVPVYTCLGTRDPFANEAQQKAQAEQLEAFGVSPMHLSFEGGHDIDASSLLALENLLV